MKKVKLKVRAILDPMPSPNHSRNRGARAIRGIVLRAAKIGSRNRSETGQTTKSSPTRIPAALPRANATTVAASVHWPSLRNL
jgi:hypothetical protein